MTSQLSTSSAGKDAQPVKAGDIPTTTFGKTGIQVSVIAQGGARMDLHLSHDQDPSAHRDRRGARPGDLSGPA